MSRTRPQARARAVWLVAQSLADHLQTLPRDRGTALAAQLREQWCEATASRLFESVVNAVEIYFTDEGG